MRPIYIYLLYSAFCGTNIFATEDTDCIEYTKVRRIKNTRYLERCRVDIKALSVSCESDRSQVRTVAEYDSLADLMQSYRLRGRGYKRHSSYFQNKRTSYWDNFFDTQNRQIRMVIHTEGIEDIVIEFKSWDAKGRPLRGVAKKPGHCSAQESVYHYDDRAEETTVLIRDSDPSCSTQRILTTYKMSGNDIEFAKCEINGEMVAFNRYEIVSREKICFPRP